MKHLLVLVFTISALACTAGCHRQNALGPPAIQLGQDACATCGMIISDARYAAAIVSPGDGPVLLFDDIGCLMRYEQKHAVPSRSVRYFHDFNSRKWITADRASFVKTAGEDTPMGSGIIAFENSVDAEAVAHRHQVTIQSYSQLLATATHSEGS